MRRSAGSPKISRPRQTSAAAPARANVSLSYFEVVQGSSSSQLTVRWGTETETNTAGYRIRRGVNADPSQAADIHTEPARGSATTGFEYQFDDGGLTPGQVYYYWLIELEAAGGRLVRAQRRQATVGGLGGALILLTTGLALVLLLWVAAGAVAALSDEAYLEHFAARFFQYFPFFARHRTRDFFQPGARDIYGAP